MKPADDPVQHLIHSGDREVWSSAALVLVLSGSGTPEQISAAADLLHERQVDLEADLVGRDRAGLAAQTAAPILQAAAMVRGDGQLWASQSDQALLAQGRASAQGVAMFAQFALPALAGLAQAIASPGARMLDVGTGVGALAVAWAEQFPALTVVGIDVMPRVLSLAASAAAASRIADRVVIREQDVAHIEDDAIYHLAWMPAPFLPPAALHDGSRAVARALIPGGWLLLGHGKYGDDRVDDAVNRFKTTAFGGTPLDDQHAQQLLRDTGLSDVTTLPTPPGAPAITVGRKPPA